MPIGFLRNIVGTRPDRVRRKLKRDVDRINEYALEFDSLSDEELRGKTDEFRGRLADGLEIDDLVYEAYAVVKTACKRLVGRSWDVVGHETTWDMVPFDEQLMGAIILQRHGVAEMATGEGKTLVATMPLYLYALAGKGAHLVTVNDYLARRDSQWMGGVYEFLGLTVGCLVPGLETEDRKAQYDRDITYGVSNEFGFDYLRDNMAWRAEDRVQREHCFALIDEVDSILIDEARTPLIISGPVQRSVEAFRELKPAAEKLYKHQEKLANRLMDEAEKMVQRDDFGGRVVEKLVQVRRALPRSRRLTAFLEEHPAIQSQMADYESDLRIKAKLDRFKALSQKIKLRETEARDGEPGEGEPAAEEQERRPLEELDEELYYVIEEESRSVTLQQEGRKLLSSSEKEAFELPPLSEQLEDLDRRTREEAAEALVKLGYGERESRDAADNMKSHVRAARHDQLTEGKVVAVDDQGARLDVTVRTHGFMPAAKLPRNRKFHKGDRIGVTLRGADLDAGELSVKLEDLRRSKNTFEHLDKVDDLILREGTGRKRVTAEVVESDESGITVEVRTGQQAFVPPDELGDSNEISVGLKLPVLVSADVKSEQLRASITRAGLIRTLRTFYDRMSDERERIESDYARVSDRVHSAYALLKAYTLYTRNVDYVIAEDEDGRRQVVIVDERTGRLMRGRRWSDGLHQAVEAKEAAQGVQVGQEMQTLATITLQSFFRGYDNLAGMTGTAVSQEEEFREVYELDVEPVPTHEPIRRIDMDDLVFRTRNDKVAALVDEIERLHSRRQPVLVGTVSVLFSEMLSKLLKSRGIPHNVLNAREHEREAEIVRGAGQLGAVTIATNMAGRGTDIKLGEGVVKCKRCCILCKDRNCGSCENEDAHDRSEECLQDVPCGLRIVGSERHESQRIDRQLRGRSGRQGDPGASQFLISIEDNLMRLFGSDRIGKLMDAAGFKEGEVIRHPMITNAVDRAQKRVETNQMEARKRLMKSDSYISAQRDHIYGIRRRFLESSDVSDLVQEQIETVVDALVAEHADPSEESAQWDLIGLNEAFRSIFLVDVDFSDTDIETLSLDELADSLQRAAEAAHERHAEHLNAIAEEAGSDFTSRDAERIASLRAIDAHWADYLQAIDDLRQNLVYSGFGSQNPEFEYGMQARKLFNEELLVELPKDALRLFFRLKPAPGQAPADRGATAPRRAYQPPAPDAAQQRDAEPKGGPAGSSPGARAAKGQARPFGAPRREQAARKEQAPSGETVRKTKKPGRNDPCPCGSGKKYKKCCGRK